MQLVYLAIAIVAEVVATSALKASDGFNAWRPSCWWSRLRRLVLFPVARPAHHPGRRRLCDLVGVASY